MNGSGCKTCPVKRCETLTYRGSTCATQRAKYGLGDPQTNADRIRAMSDEELAEWLNSFGGDFYCPTKKECLEMVDNDVAIPEEHCLNCVMEWLQQPAKEEKT